MGRPNLACLLPARNSAKHLPGWLESVGRFADAVLALDDGSTDDTADILRSQPLVKTVLTNPRRESFHGWDDAANRARLFAEAEALAPRWIMWLDADELIDPDDGLALRAFTEADTEPNRAFTFRVYRMIDDADHWDRGDLWVGRLFTYQPGQQLPAERLHFVPVPTSIPRSNWVRSTVRIKHMASLTPQHRTDRFEKYREVDPDHEFGQGYDHLLEPSGTVRGWEKRPTGLPFILNGAASPGDQTWPQDDPVLSAVVISRDDEARIERSVRAVVEQQTTEPFDVIVVTSGTDRTAEIVRTEFPSVNLIELDHPALPGEARNAGLAVARGRYISFPGSHVELPEGSLEARIRAHHQGLAMVTGSMHNGTDTPSGWASYFLDHSTALPGRPSGALEMFPAHCSYAHDALDWAGGFPDIRAGEDTMVNKLLFETGYGAYRSQEIELIHHTRAATPIELFRRSIIRGKGLATLMIREHRERRLFTREGLRRYAVVYVPGRVRRIHRNVRRWGDSALQRRYRRSLPLIGVAATLHWLAGWWGLARALVSPGRVE